MPAGTPYSGPGVRAQGLSRPRPHISKSRSSSKSSKSQLPNIAASAPQRRSRGKEFQPGPLLLKYALPVLTKFARSLNGQWASSPLGDGDALLEALWKSWQAEFMDTIFPNARPKMEQWLDPPSAHRIVQLVASLPTMLPLIEPEVDHTALLDWCAHLNKQRRKARRARQRISRRDRIAEKLE